MNRLINNKVDIMGIVASGACAIHCAALPILFSLGILGGATTSAAHHSMELGVLIISLGLASWSSYRGWQSHKRLSPQLTIGLGMALILFGFLVATPANHSIMALGGFVLVMGHTWNHRSQVRFS
ncbi:MAG: hypothetical protein ACI9FN_002598 [Saprospiraceae bacterium]|jgi:hypothetical protein